MYTLITSNGTHQIQTKHDITRGDVISFNGQNFRVTSRRFEMIKRGALEVQRVTLEAVSV